MAAVKRGLRRAAMIAAVGALFVSVPAGAVEIAATGLSIPFFDDAGKLTHKVIAKRGTLIGASQQLEQAEFDYYENGDPERVVQRVIASKATWDEKKEILAGEGPIAVETEQNRLTGVGFDFALATARLNIQRDFAMTNPEMVLESDRAVVDLVVQRQGETVKVSDVKRCEAFGNLHIKVLPTAKKTYHFDEAFSDRAVYEGATHTITLPNQIRFLRAGKESTSNRFEIKLDEKSKPGTGRQTGKTEAGTPETTKETRETRKIGKPADTAAPR